MSKNNSEENKENKKIGKEKQIRSTAKPSKNVSVMEEIPKKLPTSEPDKKGLTSKFKFKKKAIRDQVTSEQVSETMDVTEVTDEDKTDSVALPPTVTTSVILEPYLQTPTVPQGKPPPTHFVPVTIRLDRDSWPKLNDSLEVNQNMVIISVKTQLMSEFMSGDLISDVNGVMMWDLEDWKNLIETTSAGTDDFAVTVIRVWNIRCWPRGLVDNSVKPLEEARQNFMVTMYSDSGTGGLKMGGTAKHITVQQVRANTPVSSVLIAGDEIHGINGEFLTGISKILMIKQAYKLIKMSIASKGSVEILASRRIAARTSPAPSLERELGETFPDYTLSAKKMKKQAAPDVVLNLPIAADALEIALRELTFLKQWVKPEVEEIPYDKPDPIYDETSYTPSEQLTDSKSPVSETPTANTPAGPTPRDSIMMAPPVDTSVSTPVTKSSISVIPKPSNVSNAKTTKEASDKTVMAPPKSFGADGSAKDGTSIEELPESDNVGGELRLDGGIKHTSITSDIGEEADLKDCNEKSKFVSFFKGKWPGVKPSSNTPSSETPPSKKKNE
ncbi:hypothetical protein GCK72_004811 [Caenorhabditis remanei]|uniref:PDZ domain-containing protein n=1 Tax=Caenorhabditis remanei TaxID=31234 RepID=A0A6A5HD66_CAERE|nr:hypothetical protein GCK72_004811 [Caenorhabditis remanei]KAF1764861.1 hypothetical protein GCK72_004811 [Caenorhabditis remanei]